MNIVNYEKLTTVDSEGKWVTLHWSKENRWWA